MALTDSDLFLVGRDKENYKISYEGLKTKLEEDGIGAGIDDADADGKQYGRQDNTWTEIAIPTDAPADGEEYVRKDGEWEIATGGGGGGGIPEAPVDGTIYGRQDATWVEVPSGGGGGGVEEAPIDGKQYARQDGDWSEITGSDPDTVTIATPEVLTPPDGAGVGGSTNVIHQTSEIVGVQQEEPGGLLYMANISPSEIKDVAYGDGVWVASCTSKQVIFSVDDGDSWQQHNIEDINDATSGAAVAYGNGRWWVLTQNGDRIYRNDDITNVNENWGYATNPAGTSSWSDMCFGANKFLGVGPSKIIVNSGGSWAYSQGVPSDIEWRGCVYGNGRFVVVGKDRIISSTTGTDNWDDAQGLASTESWNAVAYGNGLFVAVGQSGTQNVAYSADGVNWTQVDSANSSISWQTISHFNGKFIAGGSNADDNGMWSSNGVNWTAMDLPSLNSGGYGSSGASPTRILIGTNSGDRKERFAYSTTGELFETTTTLTLTDNKSYDSVTGDESGTIDQSFRKDQFITGVTDTSINGIVYSADGTGPSLKIIKAVGDWALASKAIRDTADTDSAPDPDSLIFTSNKPAATSGIVTDWGNAEWQLATDAGFTNPQNAISTLNDVGTEYGPTTFNINGGSEYWVRVRYNSTTPSATSNWSNVHYFQTAAPPENWFPGEQDPNGGTINLSKEIRGITYGNNKFVGYYYGGIVYSDDGIKWSSYVYSVGTIRNIHFIDGLFYIVGYNSVTQPFVYTSPTGLDGSWTIMSNTPILYYLNDIATDGSGNWMLQGYKSSATSQKWYAVSTDNKATWTAFDTDVGSSLMLTVWNSLAASPDGIFVAGGKANQNSSFFNLMTTNTLDWNNTTAKLKLFDNNSTVIVDYMNDRFVAWSSYTAANMFATSFDGVVWSQVPGPKAVTESAVIRDVAHGDGKYVAVGSSTAAGKPCIWWCHDYDLNNWHIAWGALPQDTMSMYSVAYGDKWAVGAQDNDIDIPFQYSYTAWNSGDGGEFFYNANDGTLIDNFTIERIYGLSTEPESLKGFDIYPLTEQPTYAVEGYVKHGDSYKPVRDYSPEMQQLAETRTQLSEARAQIASLEANEINDDATDTALLTLIANLTQRVTDLEQS